MKFLTSFWLPIGVFLILSSCSHYQLGRPRQLSESSIRTVWIAPVEMKEVMAGVAVPLNREMREQLVRNRAFRLVESKHTADLQFWVAMESRKRESLARRSNDTGLSDVLRLDLVASYQLKTHAGDLVKTGEVSVEGQIFRDSGFNESARQRIPSMLRELADDILQEALMDW